MRRRIPLYWLRLPDNEGRISHGESDRSCAGTQQPRHVPRFIEREFASSSIVGFQPKGMVAERELLET